MQPVTLPDTRPRVQLAGRSPYAALAACMAAARWAGWSEAQIRTFRLAATSGGPEDILAACQTWFRAH